MNNDVSYHSLPQPNEVSLREREDAMGAYLMMFAALAAGLPLPIINLIAAIVYLYVNKSKSRFVYYHSLHSLYAQIPVTLFNAGLVIWGIRLFFTDLAITDNFKGYVGVVIVANLVYFIFSIIAAVKARKGLMYYFVLFGKIAYQQAYMVKNEDTQAPVNRPPKM
ncbi:MAG: DUF4870 domain-containing protein [Bacteroidetes bacterium]|jgi:uncharacterized Tic20 family protein|nr:DUF4870 domain-containing protein [Bacteroidota bacterium]